MLHSSHSGLGLPSPQLMVEVDILEIRGAWSMVGLFTIDRGFGLFAAVLGLLVVPTVRKSASFAVHVVRPAIFRHVARERLVLVDGLVDLRLLVSEFNSSLSSGQLLLVSDFLAPLPSHSILLYICFSVVSKLLHLVLLLRNQRNGVVLSQLLLDLLFLGSLYLVVF